MRLKIAKGPGEATEVELGGDEFVIGRDPACDLVLEADDEVSRRHAALRRLPDGGVEIEDLGSRNGTYVDGDRLTAPKKLSGGERIEIGMTTLVAEAAAVAGETVVGSKGETAAAPKDETVVAPGGAGAAPQTPAPHRGAPIQPPAPGAAPLPARSKGLSTLQIVGIVVGSIVALIVAAIIVVAVVAGDSIDQGKLEDEISADAAAQLGPVNSVSCPDDIKSETGETFSCQIDYNDGTTGTASGNVTNGDNGDVQYTITKG